jgi:hypothetical protein
MKILKCKKCHDLPRFSCEDFCIDCLPPEQLEARSAAIRINRQLDDQVEMQNAQWGTPADEQGDL